MEKARTPHAVATNATGVYALAFLMLACGIDRRIATSGESGRAASHPTLEFRVRGGTIEQGTLIGSSLILVQADEDNLFLYRRADGRRTNLVGARTASGRKSHLAWS